MSEMNLEEIKKFSEGLAILLSALDGKPADSEQIIRDLVDLKNLSERSRFPTYPILGRNVYFRLINEYHEEAGACKDYADSEAKALIAYKGQQREEIVKMKQSAQQPAPDQLFFNPNMTQPEQPKKKFWQRQQKPETTEFNNQ